jgi:hypothetical protein
MQYLPTNLSALVNKLINRMMPLLLAIYYYEVACMNFLYPGGEEYVKWEGIVICWIPFGFISMKSGARAL